MKRYFNTCRYCGANLDPNEKCDCRQQPEETARKAAGYIHYIKKDRLQTV